jgi:membrane-anchored protein YejM (alkaline phosphatase superfamily)
MQRAPIAGSFYVNALSSLLLGDGRSNMTPIDPSQLAGRFEAISQAPIDDFRGPNFGVERNMNVLMFVMETGSIEFLDVRSPLPQHPVLTRLRHKLYLGRNHFSTFPASAESNLSLLTGIYPPRALYDTCLIEAGTESIRSIPGFIPALRQQGYKTALYAPFKSQVPGDKVVFEMTGFEKVYYGQDHNPTVVGGSDNRTLSQLLLDIAGWSGAGSPFAVAYFPQIGHGPWSENLGKTIKQRGESLARLQLDWLEKLVTTLDSAKQLDRTVIVLTGDHGVRTSMEDPRVRVGMIDEYSLHVPLLIFAPHADYSGVDESLPSSHVDLAVELAQLLGIPRVESMQGLAFHHPGRSERRQFMVASWYYGADGYRDSRESAMYSEMLDAAYLRPDRIVNFRERAYRS